MRDETKIRMEIPNVEVQLHEALIIQSKKRGVSVAQFVRTTLHAKIIELKQKEKETNTNVKNLKK